MCGRLWLQHASLSPATFYRPSAQTCSLERAAQCRDDVMRQVRQESRSFRGQEITNLCRSVRDNMACLMWHSANCQSRDQQDKSGDVILSAKSFLDRSV
ncbi:hypothetical protein MRX96_005086 [Rhipicephalus microplus]